MEGEQYSQFQIQTFEGVVDDAKVAKTGKDAIMVSAVRKASSNDQLGDENDEVRIQEGTRQTDAKLELPCGKTSETKSSSTRFLVNMESTTAESFDGIDSVCIGASSNCIGSSILYPEVPLPSDDAPDGSTLQISGKN